MSMKPRFFTMPRLSVQPFILLILLGAGTVTTFAQTPFNSGSTGADGAFTDTTLPNGCTRTQNTITCALPASGVYNLTTINIPAGITVRFTKNARNTPVTMLMTGDVTINGVIEVSGANSGGITGGEGGPGGGRGGDGGLGLEADISFGKPGEGPGGGIGGRTADGLIGGGGGGYSVQGRSSFNSSAERAGFGGPRYGSRTLLPLLGGSGGGGEPAKSSRPGGGGGGGGGAILIASSGRITFGNTTSGVRAIGGDGYAIYGGGGSGGAIRLIANTISGTPILQVDGGRGGQSSVQTASGYVRVEAFDYNTFFPSSTPTYSYAKPNPVTLANAPQLKINSVGGVNAPATPVGSFAAAPDIIVPTTIANPVTVAIQANNIPTGTVVSVTLTQENGDRTTVSSTALAGTQASSTATANVTLPATGVSVITATASVDGLLAFNANPVFIEGERVKRVEIAASFGGASRVTYITESGKRVPWPSE